MGNPHLHELRTEYHSVPIRERVLPVVTGNLACNISFCLVSGMTVLRQVCREIPRVFTIILCFSMFAQSASKTHTISFGKWASVQFSSDSDAGGVESREVESKSSAVKVRPLFIDSRVKEFTIGSPHDVTERLFVVRRAFRVNDSLPQEAASTPRWKWEPGGWLMVDRTTGHVSAISLPDFDADSSEASWYRDYAAYCGASDDGRKTYAVVAQINRRKPILKRPLAGPKAASDAETERSSIGRPSTERPSDKQSSDEACKMPEWQRAPTRVTFAPGTAEKETFMIRGRSVDLVSDQEEDEQASR